MAASPKTQKVVALLTEHRGGDDTAFQRLVELLYPELQRIARKWRQAPGATLDTTALVHEAYLKLAGGDWEWNDRAHFLAACAQVMRHVAVDHARAKKRKKRGGGVAAAELKDAHGARSDDFDELAEVDRVLRELTETEPRLVRVVECRYFAGMTAEETATALGVSLSTVEREWRRGKVELKRRLSGAADD